MSGAAVRYGWGYSTAQPRDPGEFEDSRADTEDEEEGVEVEIEVAEEPSAPVVTELPDPTVGSSTDRPKGATAGGKGKLGGKGRINPETKDPPVEDKAEV